MNASELMRFAAKVLRMDSGCWLWLGARTPSGYGLLNIDGVPKYAHRLAYEHFVGPIPTDLEIDHLCRVRNCCNPEHMEPVTTAENSHRSEPASRTHCPRGHEKIVHQRRDSRGKPYCLVCARVRMARRRAKAKES